MENQLFHKVYTLIDVLFHPNQLKEDHPGKMKMAPPKNCPVTGLNISMQAKNSKFISASGVEWYYIHNKTIYKEKLLPFLTEHWKDQGIEKQFEEIAHNIRNQDSNKRHSTRRAIKHLLKEEGFLFDPMGQIDKGKLREAGF